jgi:hypothetical protein
VYIHVHVAPDGSVSALCGGPPYRVRSRGIFRFFGMNHDGHERFTVSVDIPHGICKKCPSAGIHLTAVGRVHVRRVRSLAPAAPSPPAHYGTNAALCTHTTIQAQAAADHDLSITHASCHMSHVCVCAIANCTAVRLHSESACHLARDTHHRHCKASYARRPDMPCSASATHTGSRSPLLLAYVEVSPHRVYTVDCAQPKLLHPPSL